MEQRAKEQLLSISEVNHLISTGKRLFLAASETALSQLEKGDWIGGTIPYFMNSTGGLKNNEKILATILPAEIENMNIVEYDSKSISSLTKNYFGNGFSFIVIPAFSEMHQLFAKDSSGWKGIFDQPLVGWISGVDLDDKSAKPKIFNGKTGRVLTEGAAVMHVQLPDGLIANPNIINLFQQGSSDSIYFLDQGFSVDRCLINKKQISFYEYMTSNKIDSQFPLVANYLGAMVNVSVREIDHVNKVVHLFAPVFQNVEYIFAKPLKSSYEKEFNEVINEQQINKPLFACNCILNYLYANLEGKKTSVASAMTFGEIAYMLLNQTMVYLTIEKKSQDS